MVLTVEIILGIIPYSWKAGIYSSSKLQQTDVT